MGKQIIWIVFLNLKACFNKTTLYMAKHSAPYTLKLVWDTKNNFYFYLIKSYVYFSFFLFRINKDLGSLFYFLFFVSKVMHKYEITTNLFTLKILTTHSIKVKIEWFTWNVHSQSNSGSAIFFFPNLYCILYSVHTVCVLRSTGHLLTA